VNKYQDALNRLSRDERYQQGDEKMILQELINKWTPKPLAKNRKDIQLDWNVEVDCEPIEFVEAFCSFLEYNGWRGGGITGPQKVDD
jgi:hypothetical protein